MAVESHRWYVAGFIVHFWGRQPPYPWHRTWRYSWKRQYNGRRALMLGPFMLTRGRRIA